MMQVETESLNEKQDYYVYVHKRKDTGEVFYVGHGRSRRLNSKGKTKTRDWIMVEQEAGGHETQVLHENLTKKQAESLEGGYITSPSPEWVLVNKRSPVKRLALDVEELRSMFDYDEDSPSGLVWRSSRFKTFIGKPAGGHQNTGNGKLYWVVRKSKRLFLAHRVVYTIVTGNTIPDDFVIDHIDGNGLNNKISNLRCVNQSTNSVNSKKILSSTGEKYISVVDGNIIVRLRNEFHGRFTRKFAIKKFGYEKALALAIEARDNFLTCFENSLEQ